MTNDTSELIVVSNRLPIEAERTEAGLQLQASPGGAATPLHEVMTQEGGHWVGWPGLTGEVDLQAAEDPPDLGYDLTPVYLSERERDEYYLGFSNEILWPLFHDLHPFCEFEPRFWETYRSVNRRFARATRKAGYGGERIWIHDYHLLLAGAQLRELGEERPLGFFLHIPFPEEGALQRLPWHEDILRALTAFDVIGVQTRRDLANLRDALSSLVPEATVEAEEDQVWIEHDGSRTALGFFPISIDADAIQAQATSKPIEQQYRQTRERLAGEDHIYLLGLERLDYTKGIPERLTAFRRALERYPELLGNVTLIQHAHPSREQISQYQSLRERVEREVGRTNGAFGTIEWMPVRYTCGHLSFETVLSLYRLADVALVTPLRDGMNLVAKEYCAATVEEDGVLVLSKFAGAAEELCDHALIVNPHDVDQMARAIHAACTMEPEERRRRMQGLRDRLADNDVHRWATRFLEVLDCQARVGPSHAAGSPSKTSPAGRP